jgi:hypothetical protein
MSAETYVTTLVIRSRHEPTAVELAATMQKIIEVGRDQGYAPLGVTAVLRPGGREHPH